MAEPTLARAFPWFAGALLAAPLAFVEWPPSSDLSLHEGMVALLVHRSDPVFAPPGLYAISLGHLGQLFYAIATPLAFLAGSRRACALLLATLAATTLGAAARLAGHLGRPRWVALAVAPVAFGWALYWGFVAQMLGFALWLAVLPQIDRDVARGTYGSAARASALTVLLGFAHVTALAYACMATTVFALVRPVERRTALRLAPAALGAVLAFGEMRWERLVATPLAQLFASRVLWHPIGSKLRGIPANLLGAHGAIADAIFALLVAVAISIWWLDRKTPSLPPEATSGRAAERHRFAILAGLFFATYLAAPYSVNFGALLYARFLAPAYALAMILAAPRAGARGAMVLSPALALFAAPLVAAVPQLAAAHAQFAAVEPLIQQVEPGSAVAVLHFGRHDRSLAFDATAFGNRVLSERGGRLLSSFAEYPIAPVVVRPERRWDSTLMRLVAEPGSLRPAHDLRRLRWLLVHLIDRELALRVVRALAPEGELVDARGEWMLFRSKLPPLPMDSSDAPPPADTETLQERVHRQMAVP